MRRAVLLLLLLCVAFSTTVGQSRQARMEHMHNRKINFGVKAGFNSSMYLVSDLRINGITINEIQNNYETGYFGALFMRINMKKHFIQPEVSYNISKCEIMFDKLGADHPDIEPDYAAVNSTIHSIDLPILYGYNFVKQGPYKMSVFVGPKVKYLWSKKTKITFDNFDQQGIKEELFPFNASAVVGVGVNISSIFFDFRYEQGLHNISKSVTYDQTSATGNTKEVSDIILHRRDHVLSFSLGVVF